MNYSQIEQRQAEQDERVPVTQRVLDTIMEIRDSGETNMMDYRIVQQLANERECYSTVCWIQNNVLLYARGIMKGLTVIEEVTGE